MTAPLFWLVTVGVVAMTTGAPVANQENLISLPAQASAQDGGEKRVVAKRAEEMMYYGNQQNEPRVPMKKKWDDNLFQYINYPQTPLGEIDEGGSMDAHSQLPVDEELKERAEAIKGPSESERMEEAAKIAMTQAQQEDVSDGGENTADTNAMGESEAKAEEGVSEGGVDVTNNQDENIVHAVEKDSEDIIPAAGVDQMSAVPENEATADVESELPEVAESNEDNIEGSSVVEPDLITEPESNGRGDSDEDEDIENIGDVKPFTSDEGGDDDTGDVDDTKENSDEEVKEFLDELRNESQEGDDSEAPKFPEDVSGVDFPVYSGRPYYMWPNGKPSAPPGGRLADYLRYNAPYVPLVRDSYRRRRRRSGHVRRIKRGLPSDWLADYSGLDIPMSSEDVEDSLLSDQEVPYRYQQDDDELSRYIYGNLLNKLVNSYGDVDDDVDADVEEEIPYEEILPYDLDSDLPEPVLDDDDAEELLYDPEYFDRSYNDAISSYGYRKRSGGLDYYPDSRRKRYFYPAYQEPETHWGAFVPEKRSYDDAIEKLQRLAMALSDNPRPYYQHLLTEYKKK